MMALFSCVTIILLMNICKAHAVDRDACPGVVSRNDWGAQQPSNVEYLLRPIHYVVIQHTATAQCHSRRECSERVRNIQSYHMKTLGYHDIGISFMIGGNGDIYEGPGWHKVGAHTLGYNKKGIAISFIGNFENTLPTPAALRAAKELIVCGILKQLLAEDYKIYAHLQLKATKSPGQQLYQEIKKWSHWNSIVN